jgi:hypothetical protein
MLQLVYLLEVDWSRCLSPCHQQQFLFWQQPGNKDFVRAVAFLSPLFLWLLFALPHVSRWHSLVPFSSISCLRQSLSSMLSNCSVLHFLPPPVALVHAVQLFRIAWEDVLCFLPSTQSVRNCNIQFECSKLPTLQLEADARCSGDSSPPRVCRAHLCGHGGKMRLAGAEFEDESIKIRTKSKIKLWRIRRTREKAKQKAQRTMQDSSGI